MNNGEFRSRSISFLVLKMFILSNSQVVLYGPVSGQDNRNESWRFRIRFPQMLSSTPTTFHSVF